MHDAEYEKLVAALRRILAHIDETPSSTTETTLTNDERQAYVNSLRFDQIDARHATIKTAHAKTCRWLLKNTEYLDWLDHKKRVEHNGFFWIKGKPGTGKSTLMKYIFANARKAFSKSLTVSFFFNARGSDLEKSTLGMYRSLLAQIFEHLPEVQDVLDVLPRPLLSSTGEHEGQWHLETLKSIFQTVVRHLETSGLACFIDALDECHEDDVRDMVAVFEKIGQEAVDSGAPIHICFSSRHYPYISVERSMELVLEGQEGHQQDLENYLQAELKIGKSQRSEAIRGEVLHRANGIFLWVVLVVQILQKEYDRGRIHALRKRLDEIPDGLNELFKDILTRDSRNMEDLLLCLQWVLFAKRPLKREELYYAILAGICPELLGPWYPDEITTNDMDRFMLDCSKGLAELTKTKSQTVQFIHESVRDYLLAGNGLTQLRHELGTNFAGSSHDKLKECCQNYLELEIANLDALELKIAEPTKTTRQNATVSRNEEDNPSDDDDETRLAASSEDENKDQPATSSKKAKELREGLCEQYPLLAYAVDHIFAHAEDAADRGVLQNAFIECFNLNGWRLRNNLLERHKIRRYSPSVNLLYVFAEKDLPKLIRIQLDRSPTMDIKGERYHDPLQAALACRSEAAIAELLAPADPSKASSGLTSIYQSHNETLDPSKFLLQNFKCITEFRGGSVLSWAVATSKVGLVNIMAGTQKVGPRCWIRMHKCGGRLYSYIRLFLAIDEGRLSSIRLSLHSARLPSKGTVIEASGPPSVEPQTNACSAMQWAHEQGYKSLVRHIIWLHICRLTAKVECNLQDMDDTISGVEPLFDDDSMIKALTQHHEVGLDFTDKTGRTLLSFAAGFGLSGLVKHILGHTTDQLNKSDWGGCTALDYALHNRCTDIVQLLLNEAEIDTNICGRYGNIHLEGKHKPMIELLVQHGVKLTRIRIESNHPLIWACRARDDAFARHLLDRTDRTEVELDYQNHALNIAAEMGNTSIVQMLVDAGAHLNSRNYLGRTPVSSAIENGHEAVVRLLLECEDVDVNSKDNIECTALWLAASKGHRGIVEVLLRQPGIDLCTPGKDYSLAAEGLRTGYFIPIEVAREQGHIEIVTMLEQKMRQQVPGTSHG